MKKRLHFITVGLFLTIIFGFTIAFFLLPDKTFSEQENRSLRTLPPFRMQAVLSGAYASDVNDYFADQFPLRDLLVAWKGNAEIGLGKMENDGILLGKNEQLAKRLFDVARGDGTVTSDMDAIDPSHISGAAEGICRISKQFELTGIPLRVMLPGRTLDVCASAFSYPCDYSDRLLQTLRQGLRDCGAYLDTVEKMRARYENGEDVYYKTDHHWTTLGAYHAYADILASFDMEEAIIPMEAFQREVASRDFYGSFWSAGGMKFVHPDSVEIWTLGNEDAFTVTADGKPLSGFYERSHLEKKDHYSTFLDGVHDVVTVRKETDEDRPTLVIFKDSFANALAPFLAQHFDLVLLNLSSTRTDYTDMSRYSKEYNADAVLVVYTLGNAVQTSKLNQLH